MNLNEYQEAAFQTCLPESYNLPYLILNNASEAGEIAGKYAKYLRDGGAFPIAEIAKEMGDNLWQLSVLARYLGFTLEDIAEINLEKLASRKARLTLVGAGDNR
jgi:NTP pyrophosphatase (non-canonical NTP hydrolase)